MTTVRTAKTARQTTRPPLPLALPDTLHFLRALWRLNHALEQRSSAMKVKLGVTAQQRMVIRGIGCVPGITAGGLAELLHLDPGTLSAALRRLEARKLVRRSRNTEDARQVVLALTAKGRRIDVASAGTVEAEVAALLRTAPVAEVRAGLRVLARLSALLESER